MTNLRFANEDSKEANSNSPFFGSGLLGRVSIMATPDNLQDYYHDIEKHTPHTGNYR